MVDEVFTPVDIRGRIQDDVSLEVAWNIGKALAESLGTLGDVVIVRGEGADERLVAALVEGICLQGRNVIDGGAGQKTMLTGLIGDAHYCGGVYIAHDSEKNECVIELYNEMPQLITAENGLNDIAELVAAGNFVPASEKGRLIASS